MSRASDDTDDEEVNIFSRQLSEIDPFGVERSPKLFMRRPELDLLVKRDLFWRDKTSSRLEKAVAMLEDDFKTNELLQEAWEFGHKERPEYASVTIFRIVQDRCTDNRENPFRTPSRWLHWYIQCPNTSRFTKR